MARMKFRFFAALMVTAVLVAGCVDTVTGGKTAGVPFIKDTIEARYEKPAEPVFQAAKQVIAEDGMLITEGTLYGQTNALGNSVRTIKGKVNERTVYVRVEALDPKITGTAVQTRTSGGVSDIDLAAQIDKQIAIKLAR
jgi:PBP1b-binding outer membrane lipoprotein LpoB